jgi:hypothetical protein
VNNEVAGPKIGRLHSVYFLHFAWFSFFHFRFDATADVYEMASNQSPRKDECAFERTPVPVRC